MSKIPSCFVFDNPVLGHFASKVVFHLYFVFANVFASLSSVTRVADLLDVTLVSDDTY